MSATFCETGLKRLMGTMLPGKGELPAAGSTITVLGSKAEKSPCRWAADGGVMEIPLGAALCTWSWADTKKKALAPDRSAKDAAKLVLLIRRARQLEEVPRIELGVPEELEHRPVIFVRSGPRGELHQGACAAEFRAIGGCLDGGLFQRVRIRHRGHRIEKSIGVDGAVQLEIVLCGAEAVHRNSAVVLLAGFRADIRHDGTGREYGQLQGIARSEERRVGEERRPRM